MLESIGASLEKPRHFESNHLFDLPDGRFSKRGEVLRLRRVGDEAWLTYKGPFHGSGRIKKRRELETVLGDGEAVEGILEALGLTETFRYEKYRAVYSLDALTITLDETPIGIFVELEGEPEQILATSRAMGLDLDQGMSLSYPRLYDLHRQETPEAPPFMVFPDDGERTAGAPEG